MSDLKLPPRNYDARSSLYGAQLIAAKYCGLSVPPWKAEGEWQHGWIVKERNIHPELVVGYDGKSFGRREKEKFFVAREDQASYLKSCGYKHVVAIGLPVIYLADKHLDRMVGSLLVMPVHSLPETTEQWDDDAYVEYIKSISHHFSKIVVCIHSDCLAKGNWGAFAKAGFDVVSGADPEDTNSLQRVADLFSQFEYVTSNEFGSHVAYASYFCCKVSVFGPRVDFRKEDYANLSLYKNAPELLDIVADRKSKGYMFETYKQFVVNPWQASTHQEWAAWELGEKNKKTPSELIQLFGWNLQGWLRKTSSEFFRISRLLRKALLRLVVAHK